MLGLDIPLLISNLIGFIILLVVLYFFAYKKILSTFDERSRRIKESMEIAESVKEQSTNAEEEIKKQIQIASQQGQEIIARATQTSEEIRAKAQVQAKQDAETIIVRAQQAINAERDSAIDELRQEFADLTIMAAGKVIGETLDEKSHKELIDKVLKESKTLKKG